MLAGEPGDGDQRVWDAGRTSGIVYDRRRGHGRLSGRVAGRPHSRVRRRAGRHQSAARTLARTLGRAFSLPDPASAPRCRRRLHASGSASGLELALEWPRSKPTIVEMSWYGDQPVPVPLGEAFHARRLTLKSSQVGSIARRSARAGTHAAGWQLALTLLADASARRADHRRERVLMRCPRRWRQLASHAGRHAVPAHSLSHSDGAIQPDTETESLLSRRQGGPA